MRLTNAMLLTLVLGGCDPASVAVPDGGAGGEGWTSCADAVVFGAAGEACSFDGSCVECDRVATPTQVACVAGVLRFAAAGPAACVAGADGGGVEIADGGGIPLVDGGGSTTDAGPRDGGVVACGPRTVPLPVAGVCSAEIADCIRNGGEDCTTGHRSCELCTNAQILSCATAHGCDDEYGAYECCIQANCPGDRACAATTCAANWTAFTTCADRTTCRVTDYCFDGSIFCGPRSAPEPAGGACAAGTRACLESATTGDEYDACYDADPDPEGCSDCQYDGYMHCVTDPSLPDSCAWARGAVACCLETACPSGTSSASCWTNAQSPGGACFDEIVDFSNCANARTDCQGVFGVCF